jgi:glycerol uptake facilitator-like aquaporin
LNALRAIYRYWLTILWLAIVAQIAGAAYGAFYAAQKLGDQSGSDEHKLISEKTFDHGFGFHTAFGYLIFLGAVLLLLLSLVARLGKRQILLSLTVPLLIALQIVLAWISEGVHGVGILHGLNALVIFAFVGWLTGEQWRAHRATASASVAPQMT